MRKEYAFCEDRLRDVGANIRTLRSNIRMSQVDLANECDMEKSTMSRIEAGQANVTFSTLCRIADALHLTIIQLLEKPVEA